MRTRSGGRSRVAVMAEAASAAVSTVQCPLSSSSRTRRILASSSTTRMRGVLWAGWALGSATAAAVGAGTGSGNGPPAAAPESARLSHHTRARRAGGPGALSYPLIPTVNAAVYPFVVSPPVIVASSDERLSANTTVSRSEQLTPAGAGPLLPRGAGGRGGAGPIRRARARAARLDGPGSLERRRARMPARTRQPPAKIRMAVEALRGYLDQAAGRPAPAVPKARRRG